MLKQIFFYLFSKVMNGLYLNSIIRIMKQAKKNSVAANEGKFFLWTKKKYQCCLRVCTWKFNVMIWVGDERIKSTTKWTIKHRTDTCLCITSEIHDNEMLIRCQKFINNTNISWSPSWLTIHMNMNTNKHAHSYTLAHTFIPL